MARMQLLPEWAKQDAVLLTWPHADTDWRPILERAEAVYCELAKAICSRARLIVAAPAWCHEHIHQKLSAASIAPDCYKIYASQTNDTWARDHGPLTVAVGAQRTLLDFTFNGWGAKFESELDNCITGNLASLGAFNAPVKPIDTVLEGGALEIDETGALLTTAQCLLNPNRNPQLSKDAIEAHLRETLGAIKVNWLEYGYLAGDDTDSHIDTLARLGPNRILLYVGCDDPQDEHFEELAKMQAQIETFTNAAYEPYRLFRLPLPSAVYSETGDRLPATYANFLILNGAVLVPLYSDPNDAHALDVIGAAFSGYDIIGIDCLPLIEQHGSLHCVTMQLPEGVVNREKS
ncbi:agmatine deiminase family protein [Gilvimarinus sp. SDUM040013]|uniref:Agmatine deiminase family protein n=1 Tax=Gilvimarinus gilvus TaxID=3058038 RepID=A0ABU4RYQ4_9GAMM|nr:agmatine deiminase family protein [Gilvimarinus sp. SDUM040013]MDO3385741.1 agmatine deiminase family protein [Gilvimarinus sp. SDUM040013]MDX6849381.1 agmatine deiminase family protein [Gilvimarinus sp. SDUM040013]